MAHMIKTLHYILPKRFFFNFWKNQSETSSSSTSVKTGAPESQNYVLKNKTDEITETYDQLLQFTSRNEFNQIKLSSSNTLSLINQLLRIEDLQKNVDTEPALKKALDQFCQSVWDSSDLLQNKSIVLHLFWLCSQNDCFRPNNQSVFFFDYFTQHMGNTTLPNMVQLLSAMELFYQNISINPDEENQVQIMLNSLANQVLRLISTQSPHFDSVVTVLSKLRQINFDDPDFFQRAEEYLVEHLKPFNANRTLSLLGYLSEDPTIAKSSNSETVLADISVFVKDNLQFCSATEAHSFAMIFMKQLFHFENFAFQLIIEKILEKLISLEIVDVEAEKLIDLLALSNGKVSIYLYTKFIGMLENHFVGNLKTVKPPQIVDLMFYSVENNIPLFNKTILWNKIAKQSTWNDLRYLLKAVFVNINLVNDEAFTLKSISILTKSISESTTSVESHVSPELIFPFIYFLNVQLDKQTIQIYEKYIEQFCCKFTFHNLGIILWSVVKKTKLSSKCVYQLLQRYSELLVEYQKNLESQSNGNNQTNKKQTTFEPPKCWEIFTIISGFANFKFDPEEKTILSILSSSVFLVQQFLQEFNKMELIILFRVYVEQRSTFGTLYSNNIDFYDAFLAKIKEKFNDWNSKELTLILFVLSENKILMQKHLEFESLIFEKIMLLRIQQTNTKTSGVQEDHDFEKHI